MPFLRLTIAAPALETGTTVRLQKEITALMAHKLGKKAELTAVLIERATGAWSVGGNPAARAAHLDVKITTGTNSAAEKAAFIAEAHALMQRLLGPELPLATYVVVDEIPAESWGYAGVTQAQRARDAAGRSAGLQAGAA